MSTFLAHSGLELDDVYANNRSWTELRRAAGMPTAPAGDSETQLLRAVGRLLHGRGRLFLAEADLFDSQGQLLGRGSGVFTRSAIPLDPRIGYA